MPIHNNEVHAPLICPTFFFFFLDRLDMTHLLDDFLIQAKQHITRPDDTKSLIIVTGNDSADLDSIISSLLFAFLSQQSDNASVYIPLVKVPGEDLALRPEVNWVFEQAGVDVSNLICIDKVDLDAFPETTKVVLIDHNRLTPPFDEAKWSNRVVGVLDHHVDEKYYLDSPLRQISMVGSCMSLVIVHFMDVLHNNTQYKHAITKLALAPILVDTIGLRWELGKTTETDVEVYDFLGGSEFKASDTMTTSNDYYDQIETVKSRVQHLCCRDLLRKDYKEFVVNGYRVGTSSMSWYLQAWTERDGIEQMIESTWDFVKERKLDLEIILTSYDHAKETKNGVYERELAFFIAKDCLLPIKKEMEDMKDVELTSLPFQYDSENGRISFYNQGAIKMSRKQIWPLVQTLLEKKPHA
ncbi:uncharacterized protein BYT42DRAFT_569940 [Radiomyces spectabilis]|uniref:uncharacterized protein n=1 Tax=Radiomyces spectabilis TaxID=64574 RepID=UPI00221F3DB6|nr:uncharacterized protein BYT42DRAFT_569940 [Radiomyces spectabilis]KAI8379765.1 hypothetical protein BYT42DRAFT_569940 [Radiomyces spectabilis]